MDEEGQKYKVAYCSEKYKKYQKYKVAYCSAFHCRNIRNIKNIRWHTVLLFTAEPPELVLLLNYKIVTSCTTVTTGQLVLPWTC